MGARHYPKLVKDNAFALYANGMSPTSIAQKLGIPYITICDWQKKYKWRDRASIVEKRSFDLLNETLATEKANQKRILQMVEDKFIEQLWEGKVDIKTADIIASFKHTLFLLGMAETKTETQINIFDKLKEEINKINAKQKSESGTAVDKSANKS